MSPYISETELHVKQDFTPGEIEMSQSLVALSVKLEARTRHDGCVWLAWCPPLDVMTQAENEQLALSSRVSN